MSARPQPPHETAGEPFVRLVADGAADRAVANLRLLAAGGSLLASIWLASLGPSLAGWVWVVLGIAASLGWVAAFRRGRKRARAVHSLSLEEGGLVIDDAGTSTRLDWREVSGVEADEDRLVVRVIRGEGEDLLIEPRYRGLALDELAERIERARLAATTEVVHSNRSLLTIGHAPEPGAQPNEK